MQHFLASEADLLAYDTLGKLFAHLGEGVTPDIERMRQIKAEYDAKKAELAKTNIFTGAE